MRAPVVWKLTVAPAVPTRRIRLAACAAQHEAPEWKIAGHVLPILRQGFLFRQSILDAVEGVQGDERFVLCFGERDAPLAAGQVAGVENIREDATHLLEM